ncbi:hypothetical protein [Nocardioides euryhalodurans]|uniref:Uncharacterized protein n=1 Tax=Nocardioides euryhalodurans TaxID=2518370 RepID=A0A4P7GMD3_9ACTN|nr:hypothetical protein [Nocardioides euryhalodurans]QBR93069.1 hypothetical protein EXE57_12915 [Nocardioides euryhalodurans]
MNTLQDLRATLDAHAGAVHDDPVSARVAAVRGRARRVRRQRAGAVVAGAVAVVVGIVSVPMLVDTTPPVPAERLLAGHVAPAELTSLGYTYQFVEGVESGDGNRASLRLLRADGPRLITWASDAEQVLVDTPYDRTRSDRTEFDDFAIVDGAESGRWSVRARGEDVGLAVYELTDDLPPGAEQDGVFFREQVDSEQLVEAAFSEVGDTELIFRTTLPEGDLRLADFCSGVPEDLWINLSINGDGGSASSGCDEARFDAAVGSATFLDEGDAGAPGETVDVRVWLTRRSLGDEAVDEAPGARLALGLYARGEPAAQVAGWDMQPVVEHEGHRWQFVETATSSSGEDRLAYRNEGGGNLLVVGSFSRIGRGSLELVTPDGGFERTSGGLGGSDIRELLQPGDTVTMRVRTRGAPVPSGAEFGLAVYERLD